MNEIINAVKNGQKVETTDLLNVVNDFCLTRLRLRTPDGKIIMSMQVNTCEEHDDKYEFSQSCTMFDDVVYYLKKDNIETVEGEYNSKVDTLYITCKSESLKGKMLEQIETTTSTAKSTETALDRITNKYKELTDVIGSNLNLIKSQISLLETRGSTVGRAYYDELISQSTEKINVLTEKYNELRKQFLQTDKGTEEWLELNAAILETQNAIIEAKTDIEGFQNSIDKLHWDELDKIADAIGNISDEAKSVIDLLDTDTVLDDNGNLTKDAITALGMYGEQLESAQYLIRWW